MNKELDNKLQRGLALTVKESLELYQYIKSLEQEQKWIPVTERLPEDEERVLTTIKIGNRREPKVRSGIYSDGLFMNDNGDTWSPTDVEITAWMPLPEPYKAESEKQK